MRPAHFHLMITAEGYQPLVTQLYFSGDTYITTDLSSSSPAAKRRILEVQTLTDKTKKVLFNVSLSDTLAVEPAAIDRLIGIYIDDQNKETEFFKKNNVLWRKMTCLESTLSILAVIHFNIPACQPESIGLITLK
jgi:catechol 1,2-dioxygenase